MMRVVCWLLGLVNDLTTDPPEAEPAHPEFAECQEHGCGNPRHPGEVLCHPHLQFEKLDFYNPRDGWGQP